MSYVATRQEIIYVNRRLAISSICVCFCERRVHVNRRVGGERLISLPRIDQYILLATA
jgi:hypothetical protein